MGLVAVRLAQREKPLEGLLTAEDTLAVIAALVTHLRVDWPSGAEAEVGDLTAAAAKGSEEAGLESLFLGGRGASIGIYEASTMLSSFTTFCKSHWQIV